MSAGDQSVEKLRELAIRCRRCGCNYCDDFATRIEAICVVLVADRDRLLETFEKLNKKWKKAAPHNLPFVKATIEACIADLGAAIKAARGGKG